MPLSTIGRCLIHRMAISRSVVIPARQPSGASPPFDLAGSYH
jgi:hypothetical protein